MKDDYKEYYESDEANLDSKSDAKVILLADQEKQFYLLIKEKNIF